MNLYKRIKAKITVFDYFAVTIILFIVVFSFVFFYRKSEYTKIRVKVTDTSYLYTKDWIEPYPPSWYADRFKVGDRELDTLGQVITEVTGIQSFDVGDGRKAVYLDLKIRATYDTRTGLYSARGKNLTFGIPIRFNLSGITFDGIVTEVPNSEYQAKITESYKTISVIVRGVEEMQNVIEPEVLSSIQVGSKMSDSNGEVMAEVMSLRLTSALRITRDDRGNLYKKSDPFYKDMQLEIKVRTKNMGGVDYIFDDLPIRIGSTIPLTLGNVFIEPKILSVK